MEWLTNLLGFANNGTSSSPFGALGNATAMTPPGGGSPNMPLPRMNLPGGGGSPNMPLPNMNMTGGGAQPSWLPQVSPPSASGVPFSGMANPAASPTPAPTSGGMQLPGIWGKMLGQGGGTGTTGSGLSGGQSGALGQALNLMKGPQMQPVNWMHLLSGPGGGGM